MDLFVLGVGIAERVLYRFLDSHERRLRVETLEHEVERLAREAVEKDETIDVLRLEAVAKAEAYSIVDQIDWLKIEEEGRLRRRPALVKGASELSPAAALARLRDVVDGRRRELDSHGADLSRDDVPGRTDGEGRSLDPQSHDEVDDLWTEDPQIIETAISARSPTTPSPAVSDPRLRELAARVRDRRGDR